MRFLATFQFVPALLLLSSASWADLIIDIQDASFSPGGTGFVDVLISSNSTDDLGIFSAKFQITQTSGGGFLAFQNKFELNSADTDRQKNSERSDGNYVFSGTLGRDAFFQSQPSINGQSLVQFDRSSADVTLDDGTKLLARLELTHGLPAGTTTGGTYEISLVSESSTRFQLLNGDAVTIAAQSFDSANFGTITVSAVPEPSSGLLLLSAFGIGMFRRRRIRVEAIEKCVRRGCKI